MTEDLVVLTDDQILAGLFCVTGCKKILFNILDMLYTYPQGVLANGFTIWKHSKSFDFGNFAKRYSQFFEYNEGSLEIVADPQDIYECILDGFPERSLNAIAIFLQSL